MSKLNQQKQSVNADFPNVRPSLDLRFALAKKLDPRITFTRGTTGTYIGPDGLIKTAAANEPRFDHDPITGECKGLLIEESRANLFFYSEDHTDAVWIREGINAVSSNVITAPDGTLTADKIVGTSGNKVRQSIYQSVSVTSGVKYTFSRFLKAGERKYACIWFDNTNISEGAFYGSATIINLETGTIDYNGFSADVKVVPYPNGWYRVYISATPTFTGSLNLNTSIGTPNNYSDTGAPDTYKYTGDGSSGLYVWGVQFEVGSFPTSYMPTTTSQFTRSADLATMTGTNFSSWYNQNEGTIVTSSKKYNNVVDFTRVYSINDGTANNVLTLYYTGSSIFGVSRYLGGSVFNYNGTQAYTNLDKIAVAYNAFNLVFTSNGINPIISSISGTVTPNQLQIGREYFGTSQFNGAISRLTYYPIVLTQKQLTNLTS